MADSTKPSIAGSWYKTGLSVIIAAAAFTGYNIGSGFITGIEALQFFCCWGTEGAFVAFAVALVCTALVCRKVYRVAYEKQFPDKNMIYSYFCGRYGGVFFAIYIYVSMLLTVLLMMSGTGATLNQYLGLPSYVGALLMGALCIITALFKFEKLRNAIGNITIFTMLFIFALVIYSAFVLKQRAFVFENAEQRADAALVSVGFLGIHNRWVAGLISSGMLVNSGFAWTCAGSALCKSRREAEFSGVLSPVFFYATTLAVVYLLFANMSAVTGMEVPMLAVVQHVLPSFAPLYSLCIVLAIYSTVSGRLFLLGERYSGGSRRRAFLIVTAITIVAVFFGSFIPFAKMSKILSSFCGGIGAVLAVVVLFKRG